MSFSSRSLFFICFLIYLSCFPTVGSTQSKWQLNLGAALWPNNCDIPSGAQNSSTGVSAGPNITLSYGKFRFGGTFFVGRFDVHPQHGIELNEQNEPVFSDHDAHERGFTSDGLSKRWDLDVNLGYQFNRYARLSFSFVMNKHRADIVTYWSPKRDADGDIVLPSDDSRLRILDYVDTQYWIGQNFGGSIPVETVSTRFSIFYNTSLLILAGETGSGVFEQPIGTLNETGPRTSYTDEDGDLAFPPRDLGSRSFGDNLGMTFNSGFGFQLIDKPAMVIYGGYNVKFFSEKQSSLIDHSVFRGWFAGLSINIY
jgi:hypothetical protein